VIPAPLVALVGNPNAGKSALFNALTGARQKVGNYPGVTVERHVGRLLLPDGRACELIDLPGAYSLDPSSLDEAVTRDVVTGRGGFERAPDALLVVVDAGNLDNHLRFALKLAALGRPMVVALNRVDLAERDGLTLDADALARELGVPVIPTVAVRRRGLDAVMEALAEQVDVPRHPGLVPGSTHRRAERQEPEDLPVPRGGPRHEAGVTDEEDRRALQKRAREAAKAAVVSETPTRRWTRAIDRVALHPVAGPSLLLGLLFVMFQAVFTWAATPADVIDEGLGGLSQWVSGHWGESFWRSLVTDGLIAGVGSVVVFLPQILILFLFILVLEASGYMVRAAFLMDRLMAGVGLSGRAFIPLLSSFACAVPGIMATRTIEDEKDRLTTILIAPLMTCSARWPVYTLIIGAMIPNTQLAPFVRLQGLVMFALLITGIAGAYGAAWVLRRTVTKGGASGFLLEMPRYQWPSARDVALGLWTRAAAFLKRAGTVIAGATVVLWLLLSFPKPPEGSGVSPVDYSVGGRIGHAIEAVVRPIGFNRDIALSLLPAMAAREVAVAAIGTVYAIDDGDSEAGRQGIAERLRARWSLPTALAFLMWFVWAPQCISTIAVTRRETNGWRWPAFMVGYLFAAAYIFAGITYWLAILAGL
jgi:ferrous iron transport protein B